MAKNIIEPRMLTMADVCAYIGLSATWLSNHRDKLEALGFPKRHPVTKNYDRKQVDAWIDKTGGNISMQDTAEAEFLSRINGKH